jgi:hypothetical protein
MISRSVGLVQMEKRALVARAAQHYRSVDPARQGLHPQVHDSEE